MKKKQRMYNKAKKLKQNRKTNREHSNIHTKKPEMLSDQEDGTI